MVVQVVIIETLQALHIMLKLEARVAVLLIQADYSLALQVQ